MKYPDAWKGHLKQDMSGRLPYGTILWDGQPIGTIHNRSKPGHVTPGGMQTNEVFVTQDGIEHATMTLALTALISKA